MKYCKIFLFIFLFSFLSLGALPAVTYDDISGKWRLMYKNNFGYEFRFQNNYRAFCIIYSGTNAMVFKGIYSIENNRLTININELKNEDNIRHMNFWNKFTKISSSYFIFDIELSGKEKNKTLILKPRKTIIDGNDSNGYFESEVKVARY